MAFDKRRFALFFSMPLSAQDWLNLAASKVSLVMLPLAYADAATLRRLSGLGIRVIIRLTEDDYYDDFAPARIKKLVVAAAALCSIDAVIIGVEPDSGFVLSYDSKDWGQSRAYEHRRRFDAVRRALGGLGIAIVSPGYRLAVTLTTGALGRAISEDDPPAAGFRDWIAICTLPDRNNEFGYDEADGNGVHIYLYDWAGVVDELRSLIDGRWYTTLLHKPIWIDEIGVGNGHTSDTEKMRAYIAIAEILLSRKNARQHPLGARTELLCPFVSNGVPDGWPAYFLLDDPAAYVELGTWLAG